MIGFIVDHLLGPFWPYLAGAAALAVAWLTGRAGGASKQKAKQAKAKAKAEAQAHERMNNADLGIGATDGERIDRLRDFAAKHGNGQAKGKGG